MTSDYQMTCLVRQELAPLPSDLVELVLDFANPNADRKQVMMDEFTRFAIIIPEIYIPDSGDNILATTYNIRNKIINPRLHTGPREPNSVRNLRYSLEPCIDSYTRLVPVPEIESDYASCLHPTTISGGGCTATIISWRDTWLWHLASNRTDNANGVLHPFLRRKQKARAASARTKRATITGTNALALVT